MHTAQCGTRTGSASVAVLFLVDTGTNALDAVYLSPILAAMVSQVEACALPKGSIQIYTE